MTTQTSIAVLPAGKHSVFIVCEQQIIGEGVTMLVNAQSDLEVIGSSYRCPEALPLLRTCAPKIILLIADVGTMDGPAIIKELKAVCQQARVLVLANVEDPWPVSQLMKAGASGFLLASSPVQALFQAIRSLAAGGVYLDDGMIEKLVSTIPLTREEDLKTRKLELSTREKEVLRFIARGYKSCEIAERLGIAPKTVETHRARGMKRLNLHSRANVVEYGIKQGWLNEGANEGTKAPVRDTPKNHASFPIEWDEISGTYEAEMPRVVM
ncbi:MAG: response regulator transcription factor [Acidobacteriota bacterium]